MLRNPLPFLQHTADTLTSWFTSYELQRRGRYRQNAFVHAVPLNLVAPDLRAELEDLRRSSHAGCRLAADNGIVAIPDGNPLVAAAIGAPLVAVGVRALRTQPRSPVCRRVRNAPRLGVGIEGFDFGFRECAVVDATVYQKKINMFFDRR